MTSPEQIEVMKWEGYSGLMCNKHVCVILRLAVLIELRLVTDRQTDRQTQAHG